MVYWWGISRGDLNGFWYISFYEVRGQPTPPPHPPMGDPLKPSCKTSYPYISIRPAVTENSSGKKKWADFGMSPWDPLSSPLCILKPSCTTSYQYPQITEQSVQWLLRTRPGRRRIRWWWWWWWWWKLKKKKKKKKKLSKNNVSSLRLGDLIKSDRQRFKNCTLRLHWFNDKTPAWCCNVAQRWTNVVRPQCAPAGNPTRPNSFKPIVSHKRERGVWSESTL